MVRATLIALVSLAAIFTAQAQTNWPQRPITFVVSNGAGSSPDVMARLLGADRKSTRLNSSH